MKGVRPYPVLGDKDAERLAVSPITGKPRPPFSFDVRKLERVWKLSEQGYLPNEAVLAFDKIISAHLIRKRLDALGATPREAHELASKIEGAVAELREVLGRRLFSPFITHDLEEGAARVDEAAQALRSKAGEPHKGGGKQAKGDLRKLLARDLTMTFEANGWPLATGKQGLLGQTLVLCLEAAGEEVAHPDRLLKEAAKATR